MTSGVGWCIALHCGDFLHTHSPIKIGIKLHTHVPSAWHRAFLLGQLHQHSSDVTIVSHMCLHAKICHTFHAGSTVTEICVGTGPCGELRYPAYQEKGGKWSYFGGQPRPEIEATETIL